MRLIKKIVLLASIISTTLLNGCLKNDTKTEPVEAETTTLKTFQDIAFSLDKSEGYDAGLYFSTELGKSYKTSQIDAIVLPKIDIAFFNFDRSGVNYFMSPNDKDNGIKNAPLTLFINYTKNIFTVDQFNKITNGSDFDSIAITASDNESFPDSAAPNVVLFKNAAGKKGAICIKSIHRTGYNPRIVVDIKIQK